MEEEELFIELAVTDFCSLTLKNIGKNLLSIHKEKKRFLTTYEQDFK